MFFRNEDTFSDALQGMRTLSAMFFRNEDIGSGFFRNENTLSDVLPQ
jgi:hypothetical protein